MGFIAIKYALDKYEYIYEMYKQIWTDCGWGTCPTLWNKLR